MELSYVEYSVVYNVLSLTIAAMGASGVFFIAARRQVAKEYRPALLISALVVFIACYHYFRIFQSWEHAFQLSGGSITGGQTASFSGQPFNEAYRYADWLITVPLLLTELISVLRLPKGQSGPLLFKLVVATVGMLLTGWIGELQPAGGTQYFIWGTISSVFMAYIVYTLFVEMNDAISRQPEEAQVLIKNMRLLLLFAWGFYPVVYCFAYFGLSEANIMVGLNVGYAIADLVAKAGWGIMIYQIARAKTEAEYGEEAFAGAAA